MPVAPLTVSVELPQLSVTDKTGAVGMVVGAVVTELLAALVQPAMVCVTVNVPVVVIVLGLMVDPSLHVIVAPVARPVAVITELPQLFTTVKTGAVGIAVGAVVTALLAALVQPPTV